jgi:Mg2+/Co2+ transporter CorB
LFRISFWCRSSFVFVVTKDIDAIHKKIVPREYRSTLEKPKKLAALLIANNFLNISIILLFYLVVETIFRDKHNAFLNLSILILYLLIVLFGSVLPKVYASRTV